MRRDQVALQLYTVRRPAADDLAGTLAAVQAVGFRNVEIAGLPPTEPAQLAALLAGAGLAVVSAHEPLEGLREDAAAVAARMRGLGCPMVIVPSLAQRDRATADDIRRTVGELGRLATILGDEGIRLGYHNHAFEFEPVDGTTVWRVLLDELPERVEIELDVYWATVAGQDPAACIREAGPRVRLLHMKDRAAGAEPRDAPPGEGVLRWDRILDAAREVGVEWYMVEQDEPTDPVADAGRGLRFLEGLAA